MVVKKSAQRPATKIRVLPRGWLSAREVMRRLAGHYTNPNSVRNAAQQGEKFRWLKLDNGRIVYHEGDVDSYRQQLEDAGKLVGMVAQ